jgi:hypothetical protein
MKNLPVTLVRKFYNERKTSVFLTYSKLKVVANSFGQVDIHALPEIAKEFDISLKTLKRHIDYLKKSGNIKVNSQNNNQLIISSIWSNTGKKKRVQYYFPIAESAIMNFKHSCLNDWNALLAEIIVQYSLNKRSKIQKTIDKLFLEFSDSTSLKKTTKQLWIEELKALKIREKNLRALKKCDYGKSQERIIEQYQDVVEKIKYAQNIIAKYPTVEISKIDDKQIANQKQGESVSTLDVSFVALNFAKSILGRSITTISKNRRSATSFVETKYSNRSDYSGKTENQPLKYQIKIEVLDSSIPAWILNENRKDNEFFVRTSSDKIIQVNSSIRIGELKIKRNLR